METLRVSQGSKPVMPLLPTSLTKSSHESQPKGNTPTKGPGQKVVGSGVKKRGQVTIPYRLQKRGNRF